MNRGHDRSLRRNKTSRTQPMMLLILGGVFSGICGPARVSLVPLTIAAEAHSEATSSFAARTGYIAFETFGRDDSITHVELLPFLEADGHTIFADTRFFASNQGLFGGNLGVGYRFGLPDLNRFFGASVWYDTDQTTGELFHQMGLSIETYGTYWDVRSNVYFPIVDDEKDFQLSVQNQQFVGDQIIYDGFRRFGESMEGLDYEIGLPLPMGFAASHDIRVNVGWYCFFGEAVPDIFGYKVCVEGNVMDGVAMQVEMTDDKTFGTNVTFGIALTLPGRGTSDNDSGIPLPRRNNEFVRRNYNIIVSKQDDLQTGLTATNPATGQAYVVQHVASAATGSNLGTAENPFQAIAAAQAAGGDIVFVHADSVFNEGLIMQPGDLILGEGAVHSVSYGVYGNDLLPTATRGTLLPTLQAVAGDAITLASNVRLSGFVVDSPTGYGIVGNSVENVELRNVQVLNAGMDAIALQNAGGANLFADIDITGTAGSAFRVGGGAADVLFSGTINNSAGRALVVENTTGGMVDLSQATINDDGGQGVLLANIDGGVSVGEVSVLNSTTTGIEIQGGSGNFSFDEVNITNSVGDGVRMVDSTAGASFGTLNVTTDNTVGLFARDSGPLTIDGGTIAITGDSAVDIENTETDINLASVSSDGATAGIRIVDSPGSFTVSGDGDFGTGGLIQNATTGVLLANAGSVTLQYVDLDANGIGVDASNTENLHVNYARVTNSTSYGINSLNSTNLQIHNSTLENNGGAGRNSIRAYVDAVGDYTYTFSANTVVDNSDGAFSILSAGAADGSSLTLTLDGNVIDTSRLGADGIRLAWSGPGIAYFLDNQLTGSGGFNDGIDIVANSTTELVQIGLTGNEFTFAGGNDTGVRITTRGPSVLSLDTNTVTLNGADGTGMDFTLAESAEVYLHSNAITDNVSGGTGVRFTSVDGPSVFYIDSNSINLASTTNIIDEGIMFLSVTDVVNLDGTYDNSINGATTTFFAPAGATNGHIFINGSGVPW